MNSNKIWQPEQRTVKRSQLSFADYNPRTITEEARKELKKNLKSVGLLGGIIWNEQSGNLVSGHQRVDILDEVNHYDPEDPSTDYELRVEVVNFDTTTEIEQNLFMNNIAVQGETDNELLRDLAAEFRDVDFHKAGFSDMELQFLGLNEISNEDLGLDENDNVIDEGIDPADQFDTTDFSDIQAAQQKTSGAYSDKGADGRDFSMEDFADNAEAQVLDAETRAAGETRIDRSRNFYDADQQEQIARHNEIRKIKERINNKASDDNDGGMFSYLVVKFEKPAQRAHFLEMLGYDDLTLSQVDGLELHRKIEEGE